MTQPSLFSKVPPTVARARRKGHAGAERAGQAAGEAWIDQACRWVYAYGAYISRPWLVEDAREWCERVMVQSDHHDVVAPARRSLLQPPPDPRAWGAVCRRLQREGRIRAVGYAPARSSHGSAKVLWEVMR